MSEPQMYAREEVNLAIAWARAFLTMSTPPERELGPFLVSIAAGENRALEEDEDLRQALDTCLEESKKQTVNKVAK
jgi:hypothetical protein